MTRLLLVRHGETEDNVNQIMQGQTQGRLTPAGVGQAEKLAAQLAHSRVDAFVSSDLRRSVDTCRILARPHGCDLVMTPLLRERDWGDFTGRYIPSLQGLPFPENVESLDALKARARRFLQWVHEEFPDKTVVAVGHGIINKAIQAVHFHKEMPQVARMSNAEVRELMIGE